jgi:predicted nucleic acid-binding protein
MWSKPKLTLDTNIAIYAFTDLGAKAALARDVLTRADFMSVQVMNEFTNVMRRKQQRSWSELSLAVDRLRRAVPEIHAIDDTAYLEGFRVAECYQLGFYDALLLGVALLGGARTFYSEDMQHGLVIDEILRVVNPFLPGALET